MDKKRIAIFASGNGSNFEAIAKACADGRVDAEVALCVTDRPGAYVTERAARFGVPVVEFRPRDYASKADFETMLLTRLREKEVDLICLAGYMRIIGDVLLEAYEGRIINIHPSLLPAFQGADAIGQAMEYGVKIYGVTVHYVDHTLDGGKIISQAAVQYEGNLREELEPMIHAQEHVLYPATVQKILKEL
ncbi:MAG: phosphoribosylglycinamide formyltransferase [Muribaculaceae bacterium]|nr:phosphoribosylglycinamide formyltransferase [Muribaculaceae bacterium]